MTETPNTLGTSLSGPDAGGSTLDLSADFWIAVDERIDERVGAAAPGRHRLAMLNIPLASATIPPIVGHVMSVAVSFNARILGYQIFSLVSGMVSVDIQLSSPATHSTGGGDVEPLQFPSIVAGSFPSVTGNYAESLEIGTWQVTTLNAGDMLHFYVVETDSLILSCTLALYLQDLDEVVG